MSDKCRCRKDDMKRCITLILAAILILSCAVVPSHAATKLKGYGVYIGQDSFSKLKKKVAGKKTIVIEGQSFSKKQIKQLKKNGRKVYSYLNVGSLENYRSYYDDYKDLCLSTYENWPDESWVDVAADKWESFIVDELGKKLAAKGVGGFFLDNCDVYYHYHTDEVYEGLVRIIEGLGKYGIDIIINGGDAFVSRLIKDGRHSLITGVNQETVFSRVIDYDKDRFGAQTKSENRYFTGYLKKVAKKKLKVFLLEYTKSKSLKKNIKKYCKKNGYKYYITGSLALK